VLLHDAEELDDDLRGGSDQNLSLSRLLGVVDGIERIVLNPDRVSIALKTRFSKQDLPGDKYF
jgi:hypothetical protein